MTHPILPRLAFTIGLAALAGCTLQTPRWHAERRETRAEPRRDRGAREGPAEREVVEIKSQETAPLFERSGVTSPPPADVDELTAWDAAAFASAVTEALHEQLDEPLRVGDLANRTRSHFDTQVLRALLQDELTGAGARMLADAPAPGARRARLLTGHLDASRDGLVLDVVLQDDQREIASVRLPLDQLRAAGQQVARPIVLLSDLGPAPLQAAVDALVERTGSRGVRPGAALQVDVENRSTRHIDVDAVQGVLGRRMEDRLAVLPVDDLGRARDDLELRATIQDVELPRADGRPVEAGDRRWRGESQRLLLISLELVRTGTGELVGADTTWLAAP